MKKTMILITLILSLAFGIGIWYDASQSSARPLTSSLSVGHRLPTPQKLPTFELVDMEGKPFTLDSLKQRWSFLFFGYTACPHVCPPTLAALKQLSSRIGKSPSIQYVFVTINPEKDTPNQIKAYLQQEEFRNTPFLGVSGAKESIEHLAQALWLHVSTENKTAEHIEHNGTVLLINPEGKLAAIFTSSENYMAIARDFKEIQHQYANMA